MPLVLSVQDLQQKEKQKDMERRIHVYSDPNEDLEDDLLPEYDFSKTKPNPYAERALRRRAIILERDIAEVFTTSEQVNKALRALIESVPTRARQEQSA